MTVPRGEAREGDPSFSAATFTSYCRTTYSVHTVGKSFVLRLARTAPEFDEWLDSQRAGTWAFLIAENPRSRLLAPDENRSRHVALQCVAAEAGWRTWPGEAVGDAGDWPPERGLLALDLDAATAVRVGRQFDQWAVVVGRRGQPAELRFPFPDEVASALMDAFEAADDEVNWVASRALRAAFSEGP